MNQDDMEKKKVLYENAKELSKAQDERKSTIDNKANILLTIVLVLIGILIEFVDIGKLFTCIPQNGLSLFQIVVRLLIAGIFVAAIVLSLDIIIRLVLILKGKTYRTIDPQKFIGKETQDMKLEEIFDTFAMEYAKNCEKNSNTNEKQMKQHDKCIVLFIICLFFTVVTYLGITLVEGGVI